MAVLGRTPHPLTRAAGRKLGIPGLSIIAAGLAAAAALLPVAQTSRVTTTGHDIRTLETRKADLSASIHLAQADVARLAAGDRVEQRAREMGMVPAGQRIYVMMDQPAPESGMPARYLDEEVLSAPAETARPWWKSLLSRLPLP
jgi:hypothetical protein